MKCFHRAVTMLLLSALVLAGGTFAQAALPLKATPQQVTNTTSGKNQNPSIDRGGRFIVFTAAVNHVSNVGPNNGSCGLPPGDPQPFTFDFNCAGNDFGLGVPPEPLCQNCAGDDTLNSNLFLWRRTKKKDFPANSVTQLTFTGAGGFNANALPFLNKLGSVIAWESDQEHAGTGPTCTDCSNGDGNREIFVYNIKEATIRQVTNTTGNADTANRAPHWDDRGRRLVFDSRGDFATASCTRIDGSPCDNADGNSEIMLWEAATGQFTQITDTSGDGATANVSPRISNDGGFVAFQSTRDMSAQGLGCAQIDGLTPCANDGNGEVFMLDVTTGVFTQITNTLNQVPCSGANPNERVEISRRGKFVTFQSKCEAQLNAADCGSCNGNDEVFLYASKKKTLTQITISDAGFNRVPRISGSGAWMVFESNRNYGVAAALNPSHSRTLYILRRTFRSAPKDALPPQTLPTQVVEDAGSPLVQSPKTTLVGIDFAGGFNTSLEAFGVSTSGRFIAFDNSKGVGNQEIWFLDRNK